MPSHTSPIETGPEFALFKRKIRKSVPRGLMVPAGTQPAAPPSSLPDTSLPSRGGFGNLLRPFDVFDKFVLDPFIGGVERTAQFFIPGEQALERRQRELRQLGMNPWTSLGQAHREVAQDYPTWLRIAEEIALDPLNLVPGLGFVKIPLQLRKSGALIKSAQVLTREVSKATKLKGLRNPVVAVFDPKEAKFVVTDGRTTEIIGKFDTLAETQSAMKVRTTEIKNEIDAVVNERIKEARIANDYAKSASPSPVADEAAVGALNDSLKEGNKLRVQVDELTSAQRAERLGRFTETVSKGSGEQAFVDATAELRGVFDVPTLKPLSEILKPQQVSHLFEMLRVSDKLAGFARVDAFRVLQQLVHLGRIPTQREATLLGQVFGDDVVKTIRSVGRTQGSRTIEILNIPRALKSSFDMSASLRQGILMLPTHPKEWSSAFKAQIGAFFREKSARAIEEAIDAHPLRGLADEAGLSVTTRGATKLGGREEVWISSMVHDVPGLGIITRASERAYVTFLNKLRMDTFATLSDKLVRQGKNIASDPDAFKDLARHINRMTGRGTLGPFEKFSEALTVPFFAPKFFAARVQLPLGLVASSPDVRRMVARDAALFLGTGMTLMTLLHRGGVKIETDPRSSDFGKIRAGAVRFDLWGGLQPLARSLAQIGFEETKSVSTGNLSKVERGDAVWRFIRSKFSPAAGSLVTATIGETFLGEEVELTPQSLANQGRDLLLPLFLDDLWDAIKEEGIGGAPKITPSFFGIGTVTFSTLRDIQNRNSPGGDFTKLSEMERFQVNQIPEIQEKIAEFQENQEDLDARTQRQVAFDVWRDAKTSLVEGLAPFAGDRTPGGVKRARIQDYYAQRAAVGKHLFDREEIEFLQGPSDPVILDDLRERYRDAPLSFDPELLQPDFEGQAQERARIIATGSYHGLTEDQITERRPSSISNPDVAQMLDLYNADQEVLQRYWDVSERILSKVDSRVAAQYRQWKRQDRATATTTARKNPRLRVIEKAVSRLREAMFRGDPEIAERLLRWGYRSPAPFSGR